jgi:hypothetical protein
LKSLPPLLVIHDRERDRDPFDSLHPGQRVFNISLNPLMKRAARHGQGHVHVNVVGVDVDAPDHVQVDNTLAQLWILHGPQGIHNGGLG